MSARHPCNALRALPSEALDPRLRGDDGFLVIPVEAGTQGSLASALRALPSEALDPRLRGDDGFLVIPAEAGIQGSPAAPRLRGHDGIGEVTP